MEHLAFSDEVVYPDNNDIAALNETWCWAWAEMARGNLLAWFTNHVCVPILAEYLGGDTLGRDAMPGARLPCVIVSLGNSLRPHVVFDFLPAEQNGYLLDWFQHCEAWGVEEYYRYSPRDCQWSGWVRESGRLSAVHPQEEWTSKRLGVRFLLFEGRPMKMLHPDGSLYVPFIDMEWERTANRRLRQQLRALGLEPEA
jgi:hypothetical protein